MSKLMATLTSKLRSNRHYGCPGWTPEETYQGWSPMAVLHRARLRRIVKAVSSLPLGAGGTAADFGCGNGHILRTLQQGPLPASRWELTGFDNDREQLAYATEAKMARADFHWIDLNVPNPHCANRFDLVLSFETLEHTGDYRRAFRTLFEACRPGGHIVVAVPNETGIPGLVKFYGRKVFHKNPYFDVLGSRTEGEYVRALLRGADLEPFRDPPRSGWGDHLGFDVRNFERAIREEFVGPGQLRALRRETGGFDFGRLYVFQRPAGPGTS